jgi:hypothetical protein
MSSKLKNKNKSTKFPVVRLDFLRNSFPPRGREGKRIGILKSCIGAHKEDYAKGRRSRKGRTSHTHRNLSVFHLYHSSRKLTPPFQQPKPSNSSSTSSSKNHTKLQQIEAQEKSKRIICALFHYIYHVPTNNYDTENTPSKQSKCSTF